MFYELAFLLVICLFPVILFSLCTSYTLIIFYELTSPFTGYLPLPYHFIFITTLFISKITFLTKVCHHHHHHHHAFPYLFTIQLTLPLYFSSLFTIQFTFLPYFPHHFTIQLAFLLYFPNLFTIQLGFLP